MLVFDATNEKSYYNLRKWLDEIVATQGDDPDVLAPHLRDRRHAVLDRRAFLKRCPCMLVGTKLDLLSSSERSKLRSSSSFVSLQRAWDVDCVFLSSKQPTEEEEEKGVSSRGAFDRLSAFRDALARRLRGS